ncbi:hypothetical protein ACQP2F_20230 [Actinoplanes sp. CA-030573]|uniref:hypothetical protein n=1 Tax=Actinoplanes sp. CA-030573 TaxID=3239898 RepID=UPI003D8DECDD
MSFTVPSSDVPDACTLPVAEQPGRRAEFDALFTTAVTRVERVAPTHARLHLAGPPGLASTVRDLTARETACCSFFTFTLSESLILDIEVPESYADVLAALLERAS